MKKAFLTFLASLTLAVVFTLWGHSLVRSQPTVLASDFDVQDFYKPFTLADITPQNMQTWPYYKYVSAHWDDYALHGTASIQQSSNPARLTMASDDERLNLNTEWKDGQSFIESLESTQVKGFLVMKDNQILAEFYDNGFNVDQTQLLQSASKTFAGIIADQLIDQGLLDLNAKVEDYLDDFQGTDLGAATIQQVQDMASGLPSATDFQTPGTPEHIFEIEQGLRGGTPVGHRAAIRSSEATVAPGVYNYNDKNTDTLALLAEQVTSQSFPELLTDLFDAIGANDSGSIALTSDGTTSPAYGISMTLRDYGLFHQWIAEGNAPQSFYQSVTDISKDGVSKKLSFLPDQVVYGSQTYYLPEQDVIYSQGSMGQNGYSDMVSGISVIFLQDWATNFEPSKYLETHKRAMAIIGYLRELEAGLDGRRL